MAEKALMHFVEHAIFGSNVRRGPHVGARDSATHGLQRMCGIVAGVERTRTVRMAQNITVVFRPPVKVARNFARARIEEVVRIEAVSVFWMVGAMGRNPYTNPASTLAGNRRKRPAPGLLKS